MKVVLKEILPTYLTENQLKAITHVGCPLIIIAGPGTGKTDTLIRRAAWLIKEKNINPERLLVTTFTNKATDELVDRLGQFIGKKAYQAHVSTIHSFCQHLLQEYSDYHKWGPGFRVIDDREQFLFVYTHLRELGLKQFPKGRPGEFISNVISFFNLCTEERVDPKKLSERLSKGGKHLLQLKMDRPESIDEYKTVVSSYISYQQLILSEKVIDFAHLQSILYDLLVRNEDFKKEISGKYDYLLIDEYQDTNRLQVLILKHLKSEKTGITVVGDDDQSIYRFRGASVKSFLQFEEDFPGAEKVFLDKNFRSGQFLINAASSLISKNAPNRREKNIITGRKNEQETIKPLISHTRTIHDEAKKVVTLLQKWLDERVIKKPSDIAILFRSVKYHSEPYVEVLDQKAIQYTISSDGSFFSREDIYNLKELIQFFGFRQCRSIDCLKGKILELNSETIEAIKKWKGSPDQWSDERILDELKIERTRDRQVLKGVAELREKSRNNNLQSLMGFFYELLRISGYFSRNCQKPEEQLCESAMFNLGQFSSLMDSFEFHSASTDLYEFNNYLYQLPQKSIDNLKPDKPDHNAIQIMTVHQAKGLEFPVVVIGSALNNRFPGKFRKSSYPVPADLRLSQLDENTSEHLQDERRLFYVAMTRAQDLLLIGAPEVVNSRGGGYSRFIDETGLSNQLKILKEGKSTSTYSGITSMPQQSLFDEQSNTDDPGNHAQSLHESDIKIPNIRSKNFETKHKHISYSALQNYLLCPLQYKILHEYNFKTNQSVFQWYGHMLHQCLEYIHRKALNGDYPVPSDADMIYRRIFKTSAYSKFSRDVKKNRYNPKTGSLPEIDSIANEDNSSSKPGNIHTLAIKTLEQYLSRYQDRLERIEAFETSVDYPAHEKLTLRGRVDLICRAPGDSGIEVYDFKVRRHEGITILRPQIQLQAYALALESGYDKTVDLLGVHLLLEKQGDEVSPVIWNSTSKQAIIEEINNAAEGIINQKYEPNPGDHCQYCAFSSLCPESFYPEQNIDPMSFS